jgi:hypothetical protein
MMALKDKDNLRNRNEKFSNMGISDENKYKCVIGAISCSVRT